MVDLSISSVNVKRVIIKSMKPMVVSIVLIVHRVVLIVKNLTHVKSVKKTNSYQEMTLIVNQTTNVLIHVIKASIKKHVYLM
jgi:hypothetical protein